MVVAMSFRDVENLPEETPAPRTFAEHKAAILTTGTLNAGMLTAWFLVAFALHLAQGLAWLVLAVCNLSVRFLRWASNGIASLADPPALVA
jgi:hypothetical protein